MLVSHGARALKFAAAIALALGATAGGIAADALDAHGMLRARPGVFAAGEMLDFDAPTGGYLLQAAFATGIMAAEGIAQWFALSDHLKDGNLTHTVSD